MNEVLYLVEVDGDVVASRMTLDVAALLVKALFEEYYNDKKMIVSIKRWDWDGPDPKVEE